MFKSGQDQLLSTVSIICLPDQNTSGPTTYNYRCFEAITEQMEGEDDRNGKVNCGRGNAPRCPKIVK